MIRGALIALIGFALGELPSGIAIILVELRRAVRGEEPLFLRLPTWLLGVSTWAWFLVTPQLSHAIRSSVDSSFRQFGADGAGVLQHAHRRTHGSGCS